MAANRNVNTRSILFSELILQIQSWHCKCQQHRSYYDELGREYKSLFSPWPKQQDGCHDKLSSANESAGKNKVNILSDPEEEEKLLMANKALAKAQRVRTFHEKRAVTVDDIQPMKLAKTPANTFSVAEGTAQGSTSEENSTKSPQSLDSQNVETKPGGTNVVTKETAVIAQSQLNKLLKSTKSADRNKKNSARPQSISEKAPFKTDPTASRRTSEKTQKRPPVSEPIRSSRPGSRKTTSSRSIQRVKSAEKIVSRDAVYFQQVQDDIPQNLEGVIDENKPTMMYDRASASFQPNGLTRRLERMNLNDRTHKQDPELSTLGNNSTEADQFDLRKHGSQMSLHPQLKQLVQKNFRLKKKLKASQLNKKLTSKESSKDTFMKKLHYHYKSTEGARFVSTVQLTAVYCHLKKLLDGLNKLSLEEDSPWEHVLRYKQILEYVFTSFVSLDDQYQSLSEGHESFSPPQQTRSKLQRPQPSRPGLWLPKVDTSQSHSGLYQRKRIRYPHLKAKLRYCDLLHQYQTLQLHKQLMDTVAKEALPLLQSRDTYDSEMRQLYRCTYSLLVTVGRGFPTLIADICDSESDDDDDGDELDF